MKRDMNLVREILLWATKQENASLYKNPALPDYTEEQIAYHVHLMSQAKLVDALDITSCDTNSGPAALLISVTWDGHNFIDIARDNSVWSKIKGNVLSPGAAFTFDLLKELLVLAARGPLGLP